MKKIVPISLAGLPFSLEDDAYNRLERYLGDLKNYFSGEKDSAEIISDIELRIAEHLRTKAQTSEKVITLSDIEWVIGIMGQPSDFGEKNKNNSNSTQFSGPRRMYRDPDNRLLGGVCAGMGAYWNQDPLLFRILFLIAAIWGGVGIVVYIVLLIVIPEASTAAEKLEMRGEPINAENIGRTHSSKS